MAWKIDRDYLNEPGDSIPSRVGTSQGELQGDTFTFRLRDDDGEVYYHGVADQTAASSDLEAGGLYQAYEWAMYDSGCTDLQVSGLTAIKYGLTTHGYLDRHNLKPTDWVSIYG